METIEWKKTTAKISLQQERSLGLFKKKYSFLLTHAAEIIRDKTPEEIERSAAHQKSLAELKQIFPILDDSVKRIEAATLASENKDKIVVSTLFVKDVEVSQEVFNKYKRAKTLPLQYDSSNPEHIKIY